MRCDDIYDRHDTSATPCTCSEAKTEQTCGHKILKTSEKKQVHTKVKVISHIKESS